MRLRLRPLLAAFVLFLAALPAAAQTPMPGGAPGGSIRGRVVDGTSREPLEAATVSLWRLPDSTLATGLLTDEDGTFVFEGLRPGRYYASVSYIGYLARRVNVAIAPAAPAQNLGDVTLSEDAAQVAEVDVVGERAAVTVEIDRTSYNVADQPTSSGGTATDVLETVPAVEVDSDGNVSLRGSQNVAILINGRPAPVPQQFLAAFLRQIPSDQIERIEVIPNPSARYDPDGLAGMLNIVLKQGQRQQGTLSGGVQMGTNTNGEHNGSVNLNVTEGKWSAYGSVGLRRDRRLFEGVTYRETGSGASQVVLNQDDTGEFANLGGVVNTTVEYAFTPRRTLTFQGVGSLRDGNRDNLNEYLNTIGTSGAFLNAFDRTTDGSGRGLNADATLTYRSIVVPSRHEFTAEARFGLNRDRDESTIRNDSLDAGGTIFDTFNQTSRDENTRRDIVGQADYVRPIFGDQGKVEVGVKGTLRTLDTEQAATIPVGGVLTPRSDAFTFDENVAAAYLTLGRSFGKISAQAGVRAEQAWTTFASGTTGTPSDNDYLSFFPSAFLTYAPTIANTFRASYSRRIDRPNAWQLNPVARIDDPLSRQVGNPALRPAYTDAFELGYTHLANIGSVSLSPFYRRTTDAFERVTAIDPANPQVTNITFANLATNETMGADANAQLRYGQMASLGVNASLYRYVSSGSVAGQAASVDAVSWNTRLNASVTPRTGTTLSGFLFYNPPRQTTQGRFGGFSRMDVSLRQTLVKDKAFLTVRVGDPFKMMRFTSETTGPDYYFEFERRPNSRQVGVNLQWNFGQAPRRQQAPRRTDAPQQDNGNDPFSGGGGR